MEGKCVSMGLELNSPSLIFDFITISDPSMRSDSR